jgi:type IV secretory pathway TrbD component
VISLLYDLYVTFGEWIDGILEWLGIFALIGGLGLILWFRVLTLIEAQAKQDPAVQRMLAKEQGKAKVYSL